MARAKKTAQPPQSAEDIALAKQTIMAAFTATVEKRRAELAKAQEEVLRLHLEEIAAAARRADWVKHGELTEDTAVDAYMFATNDMHELARRVTSPTVRLDPDVVQAARRKHEVTKRWLADRGVLPAALLDPNWRYDWS